MNAGPTSSVRFAPAEQSRSDRSVGLARSRSAVSPTSRVVHTLQPIESIKFRFSIVNR
jgi:hypothetical protein